MLSKICLTPTALGNIFRRFRIHTSLISPINLMTRKSTCTRSNVQPRILHKEIHRPQYQSNTLCRHQREILCPREMRQSKRMPQHNIGILDISGRGIFQPLWKTHGRFPRRLRDVFPCRVELVFGVGGDVNCMTGETAAFPDEAAFFGEEAGNFAGDQFVGYGGTCSRMFSWISAEMGDGEGNTCWG